LIEISLSSARLRSRSTADHTTTTTGGTGDDARSEPLDRTSVDQPEILSDRLRRALTTKAARRALAERDITTVYRLLTQAGISQRQIAQLTGQSQSEVSEVLKGRRVMAHDVLVRIAQGLEAPRAWMGVAYDDGAESADPAVGEEVLDEHETVPSRPRTSRRMQPSWAAWGNSIPRASVVQVDHR
jgi:transcriptional regulator with XRE-family HTH domain